MAILQASASLAGSGSLLINPAPLDIFFPAPTPESQLALYDRYLAAPAAYGAGAFYAVTPSDTAFLPPGCRGLWIGGAGGRGQGVMNNTAVTLSAVPVGTFIPGRFAAVMSTNTTATLIVAFCS